MRRTSLAALTVLGLLAGACSGGTGSDVDASGEAVTGAEATDGVASGPAADGGDEVDDPGPESDGEADGDEGPSAGEPGPATTTGGSEPAPAASEPASTPAESDPGTSQGQDTIDPIPAGTYEYDTEGTRQLGEQPAQDLPDVTTLEVAEAGGDDVQQQVRDLRDDDGYGSRNTLMLRYGVQGAVLLASTIESTVEVLGSPFTQRDELEADPPTTIAPLGFGVGSSASFRLVGDDLTVDGSLEAVREEAVMVGGTAVDAIVVEVRYLLSGSVEGTSEATWWIRPADLLNLREESSTDVESQGLRYREQYSAMLRSQDPA